MMRLMTLWVLIISCSELPWAMWSQSQVLSSLMHQQGKFENKKRNHPYPPVRWTPRVGEGTWRQRLWSAAWCPRPHWRGTCRSGSHTWWRPRTTCPESGYSRCCWSPQAPGTPAFPQPSDGTTSHRWCGQSRSHTASPAAGTELIKWEMLQLPCFCSEWIKLQKPTWGKGSAEARSTFSGFRSQWAICLKCRYRKASRICTRHTWYKAWVTIQNVLSFSYRGGVSKTTFLSWMRKRP